MWDLWCVVEAVVVVGTDESSCGEHEEVENDSHFGRDGRLVGEKRGNKSSEELK